MGDKEEPPREARSEPYHEPYSVTEHRPGLLPVAGFGFLLLLVGIITTLVLSLAEAPILVKERLRHR